MWILISRINLSTTRRRLGRRVAAAAVVVGTVTQTALALLPSPACANPDAADSTTSGVYEVRRTADVTVG